MSIEFNRSINPLEMREKISKNVTTTTKNEFNQLKLIIIKLNWNTVDGSTNKKDNEVRNKQ